MFTSSIAQTRASVSLGRRTNAVRQHGAAKNIRRVVPSRNTFQPPQAFFNFGNNNATAPQGPTRADYDEQEVDDYFNYMGMLASDGNYDRLEQYLSTELECIDLLLLMAASEDDTPKVEELLEAGADVNATNEKVYGGKRAIDLCTKVEIKDMLQAKM